MTADAHPILINDPQSDAALDGGGGPLGGGGGARWKRGGAPPLWRPGTPTRPPYSNQLWFPIVGTTRPSPVTVAMTPECVAKDCTNLPLTLPSTLFPNRCVHCPPTLPRLVRSVPDGADPHQGPNTKQ